MIYILYIIGMIATIPIVGFYYRCFPNGKLSEIINYCFLSHRELTNIYGERHSEAGYNPELHSEKNLLLVLMFVFWPITNIILLCTLFMRGTSFLLKLICFGSKKKEIKQKTSQGIYR